MGMLAAFTCRHARSLRCSRPPAIHDKVLGGNASRATQLHSLVGRPSHHHDRVDVADGAGGHDVAAQRGTIPHLNITSRD